MSRGLQLHSKINRLSLQAKIVHTLVVLGMILTSRGQDIRLVGGDSQNEGRVEFFLYGYWTEVCQALDSSKADVACRQLGYPESVESYVRESYDSDEMHMIVDKVELCEGNYYAHRFQDCADFYLNFQKFRLSCSDIIKGMKNPRAWLHCKVGVRLTDGECNSQGRVEIYHKGNYRTVCSNGWNISDANVVCRHLGYHRAIRTLEFEPDMNRRYIQFPSFKCGKDVHNLLECTYFNTYMVQYAYRHECVADAGVVCMDHILCYWYNLIVYGSIGSTVFLCVLIICILSAIKEHRNKRRHRRPVILPQCDSETPHQNADSAELEENDRSEGEARDPMMTSSSVSSRTDRLDVTNEDRISPTNQDPSDHRHSEEQPRSPLPSAPPESMEFDRGDSQDLQPSLIVDITPAFVDRPPSMSPSALPETSPSAPPEMSPSAPPEYDVFHELDRDDFIPRDNHGESRTQQYAAGYSNSDAAVVTPPLSNTLELLSSTLSPSSNIPSSISLPPTDPPTRDPPPEYQEFIENQTKYGFVSEAEQPDTPPPEYQPSLSVLDASEMDGLNSETITQV